MSTNLKSKRKANVKHNIYSLIELAKVSSEDVYVNAEGVPVIRCKEINDSDRAIRIDCENVKCWLARIAFDQLSFSPHENELTRCLTYLKGLAYLNRRKQETPQEDPLDDCPLLEAINIFLRNRNDEKSYVGTASSLLVELNDTASSYGLECRSKRWPKAANHLSKALHDRRKSLELLRIQIETGRKSGGERFINLSMQCDDDPEASSQASTEANLSTPNSLRLDDDPDDEVYSNIAIKAG